MTREEAIKMLQFVRNALNDDMEIAKAYDMAIKALEQEPILDRVRAEIAEIPKKYPMTMDYENGLKEALGIIDKYMADRSEG